MRTVRSELMYCDRLSCGKAFFSIINTPIVGGHFLILDNFISKIYFFFHVTELIRFVN